jgi:hypothetical protein
MFEWLPNWTTAEWATVVSAFGAAVAATASWVTVLVERRRQRDARKPNVVGAFAFTPDRRARLQFNNAGPGLAVQLGYLGVEEDHQYMGIVGTGFLGPGAEAHVRLPLRVEYTGKLSTFIWACRDVDNNLHVWADDGRSDRIPRKQVLAREGNTMGDLWRRMYPHVELPPPRTGPGKDG